MDKRPIMIDTTSPAFVSFKGTLADLIHVVAIAGIIDANLQSSICQSDFRKTGR